MEAPHLYLVETNPESSITLTQSLLDQIELELDDFEAKKGMLKGIESNFMRLLELLNDNALNEDEIDKIMDLAHKTVSIKAPVSLITMHCIMNIFSIVESRPKTKIILESV